MAGVVFSHPHPGLGDLILRLPPTEVDWTYNVNISTTDTYAGQIMQILSINFDKFVIRGQFGKEGAHGRKRSTAGRTEVRSVGEFRDYQTTERLGVGLSQMTEWFVQYFAIASQGGDSQIGGHYNVDPVTVKYQGSLAVEYDDGKQDGTWKVYPVSFPSYRRSNQNFAPEWQIECEVHEADSTVKNATQAEIIERLSGTTGILRQGVGYRVSNEFSDPLGKYLYAGTQQLDLASLKAKIKESSKKVNEEATKMYDHLRNMLPALNDEDLDYLLVAGASGPALREETPGQNYFLGGAGGSGATGGGTDQSPGVPPAKYKDAIAAQAQLRTVRPGTVPDGAVPADPNKQYFAQWVHDQAIEHDDHGRAYITVKYRDPPGNGNTIPVYI
jgi:hypothetical protein